MLPIAHAGHWALTALYAMPVLIVLGSLAIAHARGRRARSTSVARPRPDGGRDRG